MPLIRKLVNYGHSSRAVIIPKSWLKYYETEEGEKIEFLAIEVNKTLIIKPIFAKEKPKQ